MCRTETPSSTIVASMHGQHHWASRASGRFSDLRQSSPRRRRQWNDRRMRRYDAMDAYDVIVALAVAFAIGLLFYIMFFRVEKEKNPHELRSLHQEKPVAEPVQVPSRHAPEFHIDPNFAHYFDTLQKKRMDVLTGRKFLSLAQDSDVIDDTEEGGNRDGDGFHSESHHASLEHHMDQYPVMEHEGYNITRISQMLLRVLKTYDIHSMVDLPCRGHTDWMGYFLQWASGRLPKPFLYFCVDSRQRVLDETEEKTPDIDGVNKNFIQRRFWDMPLPHADLVFCWEGLEKISLLHARALMDGVIKRGHHRFVIMGSMPKVKDNANSGLINVRRSPFSFRRPERIFKDLKMNQTDRQLDEKQMYFYKVDGMKDSSAGGAGK